MLQSQKSTLLHIWKNSSKALAGPNANLGTRLLTTDHSNPEKSSQLHLELENLQLPQIERLDNFRKENRGIPGLLSSSSLKDLWFDQLDHKLEDLKDIIVNTKHINYLDCLNERDMNLSNPNDSLDSLDSSNKVINQYRNLLRVISNRFSEDESYLFDVTASIYNLFYFFSSLKSNTLNKIEKPSSQSLLTYTSDFQNMASNLPSNENFINLINKSFGSLEEFLTLLNDSANSIKGNGYTWLIYRHIENSSTFVNLGHLSILNTYNNGLPNNFTSNRVTNGKSFTKKEKSARNEKFGSLSIPSMEDAEALNSLKFASTPLLAIGSNPSFYLRDYGVYGKKQYINNAINSIDWDIVCKRMPSKNLINKN